VRGAPGTEVVHAPGTYVHGAPLEVLDRALASRGAVVDFAQDIAAVPPLLTLAEVLG
jgi:hypothetical protein